VKISIKNVGIVAEAQVDLAKKLIVLCGPNNSGKTYVAYTLYGLLKTASGLRTRRRLRPPGLEKSTLAEDKWELDLLTLLKSDNYSLLKEYISDFKDVLPDVFATDKSKFAEATLSANVDPEFDAGYLEKTIRNSFIDISYQMLPGYSYNFKKAPGALALEFTLVIRRAKDTPEVSREQLLSTRNTVLDLLVPSIILGTLFPKSFILPTQRTSVNIFSTQLSMNRSQVVEAMVQLREQGAGEREAKAFAALQKAQTSILNEVRRYTMPIRDSLSIADDLVNLSKTTTEFSGLADELEQSILKGAITVSPIGEILYSPRNFNDAGPLSVNLWGSMISSLSSLVFYFRHLASKGDFIVFDEPELNLHPDNQIKIARFIATLVNTGFSVLISTHSDYIIHELNNLILLDGLTAKEFKNLEKYGYKKLNVIQSEDIQVLLFDGEMNQKKIDVKNVDVSKEGFSIKTIDESIHLLNATSTDILFAKDEVGVLN
jgi:energy-coupling factor transporter ATP-binding protein EcfA2